MVIFNALQTSLTGGIGRYSYELSKEIYNSHKIDFKIVIREEDSKLFKFVEEKDLIIAKGIRNSKDRNYYEQFVLPNKIYKKYPNAIIHYPDTMAPIFSKNKVVITVHDLAFKSVKGAFKWKTTLWKKFMTNISIKKADKIIAITNFTNCEILKYYNNINENKISVVYNGFNDFSKELIDLNQINSNVLKLNQEKYIFTISTISPRKNIDGLIKAFNLIKDETDCKLVVSGKNGWMYESVYKIVDELGIKDRVIFTGGVNDHELKYLYKNAKLFVYPSFYEGFGLPPLEAMSFGVPIAVSNKTSIPEVVGIDESFFDPFDTNQMSIKILDIMSNSQLQKSIIEKSYKRLGEFSWENCAKGIINVYEKI